MIEGSGKRKRQLAFELQNSRVFEKRSKRTSQKAVGRLHSLVEHLLCSITVMMYSQFWVMFRTRQYMHYRSFSHDITAAILVYITYKRVQKNHVGIKLFSHVRTFFCTKKFALYYFLLSIRRNGRLISEKLSRSRLSE